MEVPPFFLDNDEDANESVKVINDPIHGHFEVPQHALEFVDTPHVQRLRNLKQLGATYLVYPGASQNRHFNTAINSFENTAHFNNSMRYVRIAGLCHDLGHGPFSHLFDHQFLPLFDETKDHPYSQHEARSVMLLKHVIDRYNLDYNAEEIAAISTLITGKRPVNEGILPKFLYDVVANETCGIDTDRFDYIARDVYNVGLQTAYGFDHHRLMKFAKVIGDNICFHGKEFFNVYQLFLTRFQLHRTVYNHKAAIGIDSMVADILAEANRELKIADSINDPAKFLAMSDTVLHTIEYSTSANLKTARELVHRLRRRDLYSFVDEILLPASFYQHSGTITAEDITTNQNSSGINLAPGDIRLSIITLNFGMKNKNPVDAVKFFKDWNHPEPIHISSDKVSLVLPKVFEEKICRIYLRRSRTEHNWAEYKKAAKVAFRNFISRSQLGTTTEQSPSPQNEASSSPTTPDSANGNEFPNKRNHTSPTAFTNGRDALDGSKFTMKF